MTAFYVTRLFRKYETITEYMVQLNSRHINSFAVSRSGFAPSYATAGLYDLLCSNRQMLVLMSVQKTKLNLSGFPIHNAIRRNKNISTTGKNQTNELEQI
jgi:hypothetical protein